MKYRIVIVERYLRISKELKRTYAVQASKFGFFWVTIAHCDSIHQSRTYVKNKKADFKEKIIKVVK